jgi:hypothetical protein
VIREAHTSLIAGHFGVDKTVAQYKDLVIGLECMKMCLSM